MTDFLSQFLPLHRRLVESMYREAYRETPVRLRPRAKAETLGELIANLKSDLEERISHSPHEPFITLLEIHDKEESRRYAVGVAKGMKADDEFRAKAVEVRKQEAADEWKMKAWIKKPPTAPQLGKLKALGVRTIPQNMWDASQLIDKAMKRNPYKH